MSAQHLGVPTNTLSKHIAYLEVENERLCRELEYANDINARRESHRKALMHDNYKLRELVRDMLPFIDEESGICVSSECFVYPACCKDMSDVECPAVARIHERAHELGVQTVEANDV